MPIYTYKCECGAELDAYKSVSDRNIPETCECGGEMKHIITPTQVNRYFLGSTDNPGYKCPVTNKFVSTKGQRQRIMKEHDLVEVG